MVWRRILWHCHQKHSVFLQGECAHRSWIINQLWFLPWKTNCPKFALTQFCGEKIRLFFKWDGNVNMWEKNINENKKQTTFFLRGKGQCNSTRTCPYYRLSGPRTLSTFWLFLQGIGCLICRIFSLSLFLGHSDWKRWKVCTSAAGKRIWARVSTARRSGLHLSSESGPRSWVDQEVRSGCPW